MTAHISELIPGPGERSAVIGGTRAGKSAFMDWVRIQIQHDRPDAMQILVDTKPRYRAETERGRFRRGRRDASYRYSSWAKGPVVPNSVVVDLWDDRPFSDLWKRPGEVAILQSGEGEDWRRMLFLLKGFVAADIKGRERRIVVDECLDFTREIPGVLTRKMTFFIARPGRAVKEISGSTSERTKFSESLRSSSKCSPGLHYFTLYRIVT